MNIQDLINFFDLQGMYHIKTWDYKNDDSITLAKGEDLELEKWDISEEVLNRDITYMYAIDGVLHIEVE